MKIAVEGCAHGEVDKIYETIEALEKRNNFKVDLLLCCGDFEATRNSEDLNSMAVPMKYRSLKSFQLYYSGEKVAPILTIVIGGNHEASNYFQELPYGGWLAPNIYYLGYAGVITVGGLRIAGLSGIYKFNDYHKGRFETPPYNENTKRSVYHIRNLEVFRLKQIKSPIDIFLSHDWPLGVYNFGNVNRLVKEKQFFEKDIAENKLGSVPGQELLFKLKPKYWFAGHMHVKFAALIPHEDEDGTISEMTKFLALDKCLPKRKFLQIVDVENDSSKPLELHYDLEWLTILHYTNHLISTEQSNNYLPGPSDDERWLFTPTEAEKDFILKRMNGDLVIPLNFIPTVQCYQNNQQNQTTTPSRKGPASSNQTNAQTEEFCQRVGIDDPLVLLWERLEKETGHKVPSYPTTPDRVENNSSFVDSEMSGFCSGSDENDKSSPDDEEAVKEDSTSPSNKSRISMVLPPPKFDVDSPPLKTESPNSDTSSFVGVSNLFIIDDGSKRSHEDAESTPIKLNSSVVQGVKKFKRRNQDLYRTNDD